MVQATNILHVVGVGYMLFAVVFGTVMLGVWLNEVLDAWQRFTDDDLEEADDGDEVDGSDTH
jgi:hypothetical protein